MNAEKWGEWPKNPRYKVSTFGNVIGPRGVLLSTTGHRSNSGYARVYCGGGKRGAVLAYVHRMVAETFIPNPENKPQVNHKDSDRTNNLVENLEWVTHQENAQHGASKGNYKGAKSSFSQKDALCWAERLRSGESMRSVGRSVGVRHTTIRYTLKKYGLY